MQGIDYLVNTPPYNYEASGLGADLRWINIHALTCQR